LIASAKVFTAVSLSWYSAGGPENGSVAPTTIEEVRFAPDSPLEEAVSSEPVSEVRKFPASREFTGNFIDSRLRGA
jgi:hypothetical protein